jgi:hypothetical protein
VKPLGQEYEEPRRCDQCERELSMEDQELTCDCGRPLCPFCYGNCEECQV